MKLSEITGPKLLTDHDEIMTWLANFVLDTNDIIINANGSVSVADTVFAALAPEQVINIPIVGRLPIKFDHIRGNLNLQDQKELTSIEGFPRIVRDIDISGTGITSLVGISDVIEQAEIITLPFGTTHGGLGLLLINGLVAINIDVMCKPFWIIDKYIGKGEDGLLECQSELIESGFEEYAVL